MTLLPKAKGMTKIIHRLIRMVRIPLLPRIDANTLRNGGTVTFADDGAASKNRSPKALRPRYMSTIISTPVTIIEPTMPMSGPRRTFFTSPLKETMLTENRMESRPHHEVEGGDRAESRRGRCPLDGGVGAGPGDCVEVGREVQHARGAKDEHDDRQQDAAEGKQPGPPLHPEEAAHAPVDHEDYAKPSLKK